MSEKVISNKFTPTEVWIISQNFEKVLKQDLVNSEEDSENMLEYKCVKKDVSKLLKTALDVEMSEQQIGDVKQVYTNRNVENFI